MANSPKLKIRMMTTNDLQKEVVFNEALIVLDAMVARSAKNRTNNPPAAPQDGDTYIIGTNPVGAWSGHPNKISLYYNGWRYYDPTQKMKFFNEADGNYWTYSGVNWTADPAGAASTLSDLSDVGSAVPNDGDVLTYHLATGQWEAAAPAGVPDLDDLGNVSISSPASGQVLGYDLVTGKWMNVTISTGGGGASKLSDLEDVDASDKDTPHAFLTWNSIVNKFVFQPIPAPEMGALNDLTDVYAAHGNLLPNDALVWNGAAWGPSRLTFNYSFIGMVDGPQTFEGHAKQFLTVNATEDGMEFVPLSEIINASSLRVQDMSDITTPVPADAGKVLVVRGTAANNMNYQYLTLPTWEVSVANGPTELTTRVRSITFNNLDARQGASGHIVVTGELPLVWQGEGIPLTGDKPFAVNFTGEGVGVTNVNGVITVTVENTGGSMTLAGLDDVDFTVPATNGQALIFDAVTGDWKAGNVTSTIPEIDGLAQAALYELGPFAPPKRPYFPLNFNAPASDLAEIANRGLVFTPGSQSASATRHVARLRTVTNNLAPWGVTSRVKPTSYAVGGHAAGICLFRQQTNRMVFIDIGNNNADTQNTVRFGYISDTGVETVIASRAAPYFWFRLNFDGNDIRAFVSSDGVIWNLFGQVSAVTALGGAPNQVGLEQRSAAVHNGNVGGLYTYYDDPDFPARNVMQQGVVSIKMGGLQDVDLTTTPILNGQVLAYDAATETFIPADAGSGGGGTSLPPVAGNAGKVLAVNATENGIEWVAQSGGAGNLDDLSDVILTAPVTSGQALIYDEAVSAFVNADLPEGGSSLLTIRPATSNYTLALSDNGAYVRMNSPMPLTVTVPTNAVAAFPVGSQLHIRQVGVGQVSLLAASGVTVNTPETLKMRKRGSSITLIKVSTNEWDVTGDLEVVA